LKLFFLVLFLFCSFDAYTNPIVEKFQNGTIKKSFNKDSQGWLTGEYKEFHHNGKIKISTIYEKNKLNGFYTEYDANGKVVVERNYLDGKKNGLEKIYREGVLDSSLIFIQDEIAYSRSIEDIQRSIKAIQESKIKIEGDWPECYLKSTELTENVIKQNENCLKIIMVYRYLCEVPYKDLSINREYIAKAMAANDIGKKNKYISHFPPNPGMSEKDYKFASSATVSCNLFFSSIELPIEFSTHYFMNDSDILNREKLGHRRWCLSPQMKATGFASNGVASSMYSIDLKVKDLPETEYFAFPPKGFTPIEYFKSDYVWSISLNPRKYNKVKLNSLKISVKELDVNYLEAQSVALDLEYSNVSSEYIAMDSSCIIFKPKNAKAEKGKKYKIEITGLLPKNKSSNVITYYVEFY
jgi:antitoxin component YwqK of YwqJK toxin-antitoxin module